MIVTDIQRFSIHDGPGIRTTVFVKGCNLRCRWCHNPETIAGGTQLQQFPDRCIACGACLKACPHGAHTHGDGRRIFDRSRCQACGRCAAGCYAQALVLVGRTMSVDDVLKEVLEDVEFYRSSGGGVTVSGGEPLVQREEVLALLQASKQAGIHTAIETNLDWPWDAVAALLPALDLVMADLKLMDSAEHRRWTSAGNERVLDNLNRLSRTRVPLIVRTPVVEGVNATEDEIGAIAEFLAGFPNLQYYELLPYHPLGTGKYESLGMAYPADAFRRPSGERMQALAAAAKKRGIEVRGPDSSNRRDAEDAEKRDL